MVSTGRLCVNKSLDRGAGSIIGGGRLVLVIGGGARAVGCGGRTVGSGGRTVGGGRRRIGCWRVGSGVNVGSGRCVRFRGVGSRGSIGSRSVGCGGVGSRVTVVVLPGVEVNLGDGDGVAGDDGVAETCNTHLKCARMMHLLSTQFIIYTFYEIPLLLKKRSFLFL
jgi:hypothetical protein